MPVVTVTITKDGVTREKKEALVREITGALQRILNKKPEHTHVILELVDDENWGFAGMLTDDYQRSLAEQ